MKFRIHTIISCLVSFIFNIDIYLRIYQIMFRLVDCGSSPRGEIVFVVTEPANENHRPFIDNTFTDLTCLISGKKRF